VLYTPPISVLMLFGRRCVLDDLPFLAGVVRSLDGGRGRPAEAVEAVRECGAGALHLAAGAGKLAVCRYLVEDLRVDANAIYDQGPHPLTRSHTRERHCI
jgi:hypothetical protein